MYNGKEDDQLTLAIHVPESEREKTIDLDIGYLPEIKSWELIVKYSGSLERVQNELGVHVTELLNQYAILIIREDLIDQLVGYPEIEYIEKPKGLFYEATQAMAASCIIPVQRAPYNLTGKGVLVAIIDSGIDYSHPDFRNADGSTRILYLWDQTEVMQLNDTTLPNPDEITVSSGVLYTAEDINLALGSRNKAEQLKIVSEIDVLGHGTHVAGIACGNGGASGGRIKGVATESSMLVVKLANSLNQSFPKTTQLMTAVDFAVRTATKLKMPLAINLSMGTTSGSHNGKSLLERYLDDTSNFWKINIVVGTGNEGAEQGHEGGILTRFPEVIELNIGEGEVSVNVQMWKNYYDDFTIELISPSGESTGMIGGMQSNQEYRLGMTKIQLLYGEPKPMNMQQEIFIVFLPINSVLESGNWKFVLTPKNIVNGKFDFWLPSSGILAPDTRFLFASVDTTLTIPSTSREVISVGAYDSNTDSYAYFSGRGQEFIDSNTEYYVKPDLVAPGVGIEATASGGGYTRKTGTSMATPFVTGSAALLMEWGIIRGKDPYLYGQKSKAYLIKGARPLPGFDHYPNPQVGYGALCLERSIPE